jgi:hypothetical protein
MILCPQNKLLFLKNPKTGGNSIRKHFARYITRPPIRLKTTFQNKFYGDIDIEQPSPYFNLQKCIDSGNIDRDITDYSVYVVIRDPVDRFRSLCRHVRDYGIAIRTLFADKLDPVSTEEIKQFRPNLKSDPSVLLQFPIQFQQTYKSITLQEIGERLIDQPFNTISNFDFLRVPQNYYYSDPRVIAVDYANLQIEFSKICIKYNITQTPELPKENIGTKLPTDCLSQELINRVKLVYSEDVEFYDRLSSTQR